MAGAHEAAAAAPAPQVLVHGSQADAGTRDDFVAGKIIIGRQRIDASGVRTVEQLLKREPAVTVSGDGRIGLLNLPGYTQVLIDGQAPLAGQAPAQFDLVHVDKIEIVKSSMAEFGPYGIAGTINIVTRKTVRKTATEIVTGMRTTGARAGADLALSHNQSTLGSPLRFSGRLSVGHGATPSESRLVQTVALGDGPEHAFSQSLVRGEKRLRSVMASANVTWQRTADETISLAPEVYTASGPATLHETRQWRDGAALDARQQLHTPLEMAALPLKWAFKPGKLSQVEISARTHLSRLGTRLHRVDALAARAGVARDSEQQREGRSNRAEATYKTRLAGAHDVKLGASVLRVRQDVAYAYRIDGAPDAALAALGSRRRSVNTQRRVWVQDEWRISERLALNAGLSGASTTFGIEEGNLSSQTRFSLWSPSLHLARKIGAGDDRHLRLGLARSFKAPQDDDLTLRPLIHPLAPCVAGGLCGANGIDTADQSGNPGLRPERALGLNLAYQHGLGEDSHVTLEAFTRRIDDKIGTDIMLGNVPWSGAQRYVARPVNLGQARAAGVDLELELALRDLAPDAPKASVRAAVGLARSRVSSLARPDNRLDRQTPWTAKLGGNYTLPGWPLTIDVDVNWSPSAWVRTSRAERVSVARRTELDASASWAIDKGRRLILNVRAGAPDPARSISELDSGAERIRIRTDTRQHATVGVRFETRL